MKTANILNPSSYYWFSCHPVCLTK